MDRNGEQFSGEAALSTGRGGRAEGGRPKIRFGHFQIWLPSRPATRILVGTLLVIGGLFWFLPILGLWMLPLGVLVLSVDIALIRRVRRKGEVWWGKRAQPRK